MAAEYNGTTTRYLDITDTAALDLPNAGWTVAAFFRPDSSFTVNSFGYVYSHAQPLANVSAFNIFKTSGSKIRCTCDQPAGNLVDLSSSNNVVTDSWNSMAAVYNGTTFRLFLNGTLTTASPPSIGTITPLVNARIGYATHGGSRQFNGQICHVAKYDRAWSDTEATRRTNMFLSPRFDQDNLIWHIEAFNSSFFGDVRNALSVSEVSMAYAAHAPVIYPAKDTQIDDTPPIPGGQARRAYFFIG